MPHWIAACLILLVIDAAIIWLCWTLGSVEDENEMASYYEYMRKYANWPAAAEAARQRAAQPVQVDGVEYLCSVQAAQACGLSNSWLRHQATDVRGNNVVLTTKQGWRFIRLPRHKSDERGLLYWDVTSLPERPGVEHG